MNWRRWIAIVLLPMMIIWLSGFGQESVCNAQVYKTEEELLEVAQEKLEDVKSMRSNLTMDMDIKVFRLKTGIRASVDMTSFPSPMKLKSDMKLDMGILGETQIEAYATENDGGYQLFLKGQKDWKAYNVEESALQKFNGVHLIKTFLDQVEGMKFKGVETINGKKAYQCSGTVTSEGLKKLLLDTRSVQIFSSLFKGSVLKSLGTFLGQEDEVGELLSLAEDMPVTIWFDAQSGYPLQCSMDITRMMQDAYQLLTPNVVKGSGKSEKDIWSLIEVTKTEIVIRCSQFDTAKDFTIPKEVLKAAK